MLGGHRVPCIRFALGLAHVYRVGFLAFCLIFPAMAVRWPSYTIMGAFVHVDFFRACLHVCPRLSFTSIFPAFAARWPSRTIMGACVVFHRCTLVFFCTLHGCSFSWTYLVVIHLAQSSMHNVVIPPRHSLVSIPRMASVALVMWIFP